MHEVKFQMAQWKREALERCMKVMEEDGSSRGLAYQAARATLAAYQAKLLAGVEMPEPSGQRLVREDGVIYFDTDPPTEYEKSVGWKPIFTADQLQQYAAAAAAQARMKALDEVTDLLREYDMTGSSFSMDVADLRWKP